MALLTRVLIFIAVLILALCAALFACQRRILFYPSHSAESNGLAAWVINGHQIGCVRQVDQPRNVWLLLHGNAGQAADRSYALPSFSPFDTVFILEYPGYGTRSGSPSMTAMNAAAREAYLWLRKSYPAIPVCVAGESIGSGPAATLARLAPAPDKLVLVTPFDDLVSVASHHFPFIPARFLLRDRWDNVAALKDFSGKIEIYGATDDQVIPISHARRLAHSIHNAVLHEIPGGHNDWSVGGKVQFRN